MNRFDSSGNLILPKGTIEEFLANRNPNNARYHTGVYVTCPGCGKTWERRTRKAGRLKCHRCHQKIEVEKI